MSGIVGIVNGGSPERMVRSLDALLGQCHSAPGKAVEAVVCRDVALAVTDPSPLPRLAHRAERSAILAVCGRLYDEGLSDRFGRPNPLPKYGFSGFPTVWWWDAEKAAKAGTRS